MDKEVKQGEYKLTVFHPPHPLKNLFIYFSTPTSAFLILLKARFIFRSCGQESFIESPLSLLLISIDFFFYSVAKIIFSPALFTNFISTS